MPTPARIPLEVGHATHVGRVRDHNEDALLVTDGLYAVCDGMGGHAAGEVASRLVVETLTDAAETGAPTPQSLTEAIERANDRLLASAREHPEQSGMGTTAVVLALAPRGGDGDEPCWLLANVGDSRAYRWAGEQVEQLTRDHSEVQEMIDAGLLTVGEAARHPLRNIITRSIGMDPAPEADLWTLPVLTGERLLLCTDGLTAELSDEALAEILDSHDEPQVAAEALVRAACDAGGRDNVTVVLIQVPSA